MDTNFEADQATVLEKGAPPIETSDGRSVYMFRYENPEGPKRNLDATVSKEGLVGRWFTDSAFSFVNYILKRQPGGTILVAAVPKDRKDDLKAANNPEAKEMDMDPDNYLLPDELVGTAQRFPLSVGSQDQNQFIWNDRHRVRQFVAGLVLELSKR